MRFSNNHYPRYLADIIECSVYYRNPSIKIEMTQKKVRVFSQNLEENPSFLLRYKKTHHLIHKARNEEVEERYLINSISKQQQGIINVIPLSSRWSIQSTKNLLIFFCLASEKLLRIENANRIVFSLLHSSPHHSTPVLNCKLLCTGAVTVNEMN